VVETIADAVYPETDASYPTNKQYGARLLVGELTGDGTPDLAVLDGSDNRYFIYDGAALSVPAAAGGAPADLAASRLVKTGYPGGLSAGTGGLSLLRDVNGDGIDELSGGFLGTTMTAFV